MLYLTSDVTLNTYIQIACLPAASTSYPTTSSYAYAVGWGVTTNGATTTPDVLYNEKLTTYPQGNCNYYNYYDAGMVCAGKLNISSK